MQQAGVGMIHIDGWEQSLGTNAPSTSAFPGRLGTASGPTNSFAYVCAQIHAAGLTVGIHCMSDVIGTNDPYAISDNAGLGHDSNYLLASAITSTTTTTIVLTGNASSLPQSSTKGVTQVLQIGNELIQYTTCSYNSGTNQTTFTGVTRGAYSSTKAIHSSGANVGHLFTMENDWAPDGNTAAGMTLAENVATNLKNTINACNADEIFFDGVEIAMNYYTEGTFVHDTVAAFNHAVRVDQSSPIAYTWTFDSVLQSMQGDYPVYGFDQYVNTQIANIDKSSLLPAQLGWFALITSGNNNQGTLANYSITPQDFEYFVVKAVANNEPISLENVWPTPSNGLQSQFLSILKNWETISPSLSPATKAALAVPARSSTWKRFPMAACISRKSPILNKRRIPLLREARLGPSTIRTARSIRP